MTMTSSKDSNTCFCEGHFSNHTRDIHKREALWILFVNWVLGIHQGGAVKIDQASVVGGLRILLCPQAVLKTLCLEFVYGGVTGMM